MSFFVESAKKTICKNEIKMALLDWGKIVSDLQKYFLLWTRENVVCIIQVSKSKRGDAFVRSGVVSTCDNPCNCGVYGL